MTFRRTRRRAVADHQDPVLSGAASRSDALARLLADASAPAHADELAGLTAALTMFDHTSPRPRRNPVLSVLAKLLAAKALAALAGTAAIGGVALAAAAGTLPTPVQDFAHDTLKAPPASSSTHVPKARHTHGSSASPSPNPVGLCRAYNAGVAAAKGKALSNPAFTVLITAAGGEAAVPGYCTTLLAAAPGGRPTALPTQAQSHKPSSHPTGKPSSHPTGPPTSHPTAAPSPHATGRP